jgi:hypothetical protein
MVIMEMMAIHFAQVAQVNHMDLHLPLAILLVVELILCTTIVFILKMELI